MSWECYDGTPDEDHDWKFVPGDREVGEGDHMECRACGKTREATEQEARDAWNDAGFDPFEEGT